MKEILASCIHTQKLHPSIKIEADFNYGEVFYENGKLLIRRWGAKDEEPSFDITPKERLPITGYKIDYWNRSTIYIPTNTPETGMGLLPFHPYLFGDDNPCIYSEAKLGEINPLLSILFDINIKELPKMSVKAIAKTTIAGKIESWNSRYQRDSLGGYQQNSSYVIEEPVLQEGKEIEISELKKYGICFNKIVCPEHKLPFSKADYTPKSEYFEFIYDKELKEFFPKSVAKYILKSTQPNITSSDYGVYSSYGKSAATKLPLFIGNVQF